VVVDRSNSCSTDTQSLSFCVSFSKRRRLVSSRISFWGVTGHFCLSKKKKIFCFRKLIENGELNYYDHENNCSNQCRSNKSSSFDSTEKTYGSFDGDPVSRALGRFAGVRTRDRYRAGRMSGSLSLRCVRLAKVLKVWQTVNADSAELKYRCRVRKPPHAQANSLRASAPQPGEGQPGNFSCPEI